MKIRPCESKDIAAICDIYNYYVENTTITFEEVALSVADMSDRVTAYMQDYPWLVCEDNDELVGYAYATRWQSRCAYRKTVEVSVYVRHDLSGRGYGRALYAELFDAISGRCHAAVAGIALPNAESVSLHEKFGFEKVAHFREVGRKFGNWIDVGYWQRLFEGGEQG